ncbi:MAG: tetratricopeptide repeat protein [Myxococcales bacterium]|nr:tetratricopeptide repeat protein [Myxococcales bacterium]
MESNVGPASLPPSVSNLVPAPVAVGHPLLAVVRGELERLFSLEDMQGIASGSLGLDPEQIGGTSAKGSFARALVDHCAQIDAVEALVDALLIHKADIDPRVREIAAVGLAHADELSPGTEIGAFTIQKKIGEGGAGVVYLASRKDSGNRQTALKLVKREMARDTRSLHRFMTANRLVGTVQHPGLPRNIETGAFPDGRMYISYDYIDGQSLAARLSRTGPMHLNEARPLLRAILEALAAMHEKRLAHGDLKTENVLLAKADAGAPPRAVLVDFGTDRLRARGRTTQNQTGILAIYGSAKAIAPELVRGNVADGKSDVYAFGALLFEVLTGKALFAKDGKTSLEVALAHLATVPEPPSATAPRGWVSKEIDTFVAGLLAKEPSGRPVDARAVLEAFDRLGRGAAAAQTQQKKLSDDDVDLRIAELVEKPEDGEAAANLEKALEEGGDANRIADGFFQVAEGIEDAAKKDIRTSLLFRSARIFEANAKNPERAEGVYKRLLELDPEDDIAQAAFEELKKATGQWSDVVEMMLSRVDNVHHGRERALVYAEIGRLYEIELEDPDNAFVAYVQAWCEEPREGDYSYEVERLAGTNEEKWDEALGQGAHKVQVDGVSGEDKLALFVQMGKWFVSKVNRLDLALPSYQAAIKLDPANEAALEGMCEVYKKAQQWPELGTVLMKRADAAATPGRARDLRAQAADILETKLSDANKAKDLYQQILAEDPGHPQAADGIERICTRSGDFVSVVKIFEARAASVRGPERADVLAKIGELYEDQIGDMNEAMKRFESVLQIEPKNLVALKGLDRIYNRTGRYKELLANLETQIAIAATPRQRIGLWERIAAIHDEEFLDHERAAESYEAILKIDSANDHALVSLGRHYRALDRWEDVAALIERHLKVVEDNGRRVELLLSRGRVLSEQIGSPERAMHTFEKVLEIQPEHAGALEALAHLRESSGDANAAVAAVEALAAKAATPEAKAEQYTRAARMLETRGDKDGAIERYKLALDANPNDKGAAAALRGAYAARGDVAAAISMIEREVAITESPLQKARLFAEMAKVAREKLKDSEKAREAALKALDHEGTNVAALMVLGETAFEADNFVEAARRLELVTQRADTLGRDEAVRILLRYVDALVRTGAGDKAVKAVERLRALAPDDPEALRRVGQITFDHGDPKAAREIHVTLIDKFGEHFVGYERAEILFRLGESARRVGDHERAHLALEEAADLDPTSSAPLEALAKLHEAREEWTDVVAAKKRLLESAAGDERFKLIVELGDVLGSKLKDRTSAAKQYVAALDERPDDRAVMLKLMQLYSEGEDWSKLVEVVLRLGDLTTDPKAKGKYLMTAAIVTDRQLKHPTDAAELYERVVDADPSNDKALEEAIRLRKEQGDHAANERLLRTRQTRAKAAGDKVGQLSALDALGDLYHRQLGQVDEAIEAYEQAQALDPENHDRNEILATIYASDASRFLEKAVKAQTAILKKNPYRAESFKLLRKLYTQAKRADAAWCMCQVLTCLNLAEADEERFYKRHRTETAAAAQDRLNNDEWNTVMRHPDRDPLLTAIFATIEPAIIASRGVTLESEGYHPSYAVDLTTDQYPMSQTLFYAANVFGMDPPVVFHNPALEAGLAYVHANPRALVLGRAALETGEVPPQALAFVAGQKLAFLRPGMYVRHVVSTGTGLKAWLFGAIKIVSPNFPVAAELEGPVKQAIAALEKLHPTQKEQLTSLVARLLSSGAAIDLKKWIAACDLTADRAGLLLAHDLEVAMALIKATDDATVSVSQKDRLKEIALFAASEDYFTLRDKLVITIDS